MSGIRSRAEARPELRITAWPTALLPVADVPVEDVPPEEQPINVDATAIVVSTAATIHPVAIRTTRNTSRPHGRPRPFSPSLRGPAASRVNRRRWSAGEAVRLIGV